MLTKTATESGSKELERLLAVIGARKDQAAFASVYSATKRKLFSTAPLIVKRSDLAEKVIQEAYVRIWHCELLSIVTCVTNDLDDHHCPQSGD